MSENSLPPPGTSPEQSAVWFDSHRGEFRVIDAVRCPCRRKDPRTLAALYVHTSGREALWVGPRQALDQSGGATQRPARLVPPLAGYMEITQCPRCRRGLWIWTTENDGLVGRWLDAPTHATVTE